MATTTTRQLREPFVEAAGLGITNKGLGLLGKSIPTSTYTGRGFVADQSALEKQAAAAAANLGTLLGPQAYQQFESPYQQEVIDTSLAAMEREQAKGLGALRNQAVRAGAFGGGREAAMMGEYQASADMARAMLKNGSCGRLTETPLMQILIETDNFPIPKNESVCSMSILRN